MRAAFAGTDADQWCPGRQAAAAVADAPAHQDAHTNALQAHSFASLARSEVRKWESGSVQMTTAAD